MKIACAVFALLVTVCLMCAAPPANGGGVRIWEEPLTLPTYLSGAPDRNPLFYEGRTYQGAKGPIYPYPIVDKLTEIREPKTYKAVYLENDYLKICVLPELGGRIFSAVDKTNNYDFFYRQHVLKPALIGMLGAWISGGVEWNIPHHHRASSFMPVQYKLEESADGSRTVWVGELELRHRMRWVVGLTLNPGKSYIEVTVRLFNRTPLVQSILFFANVAVHTNPDYQVIFPPSAGVATQHSKSEFSRWPIGSGIYAGQDFRGVDVSWWKNHKRSISMFAHEVKEDFVAGYDHGRKAGTLLVADHGTVPGKKFFTWGVGSAWDNMLIDTDGPYLELMVGGYSDNQPDYSWVQPYEVKSLKQYWYAFQQIGGVKNANAEAALNLEMNGNSAARIGVSTTASRRDAEVTLEAGARVLLKETVAIDPGTPYRREVILPAGVKEEDLRLRLAAGGKEVIAYRPVRRQETPLPEPVERPLAPKDVKTVEELYLTGLRLEEFHSPAMEPDPYYEEALRREPSHYDTNTAYGILLYRRGRFEDAEKKLRAAVARATKNYTNPKDGEALYYLGLVLKARNKKDEAYEILYRATWSYAWHTAAYYALAEIVSERGDYERAAEFVGRSLVTNSANTKALLLKAALLRKLGRPQEAQKAAQAALALDPLDRWGARELVLAENKGAGRDRPVEPVRSSLDPEVQMFLETAVDYANAGLWDEAGAALQDLVEGYADRARVYPMAYYWLGYLAERSGKPQQAAEYYQQASRMPPDYCFPFRLESIQVLRQAMASNPKDARAPYYLGNLLYDSQPEAAVLEWEKARQLDPEFPLVHRNLAWAYSRSEQNVDKAIASLEKAIALRPEPRHLFELDRLYEAASTPAEKRLALLEKHHSTAAERDDSLEREIRLCVQLGKYERALELLSNRRFYSWEGGARFSVHASYIDAHLLLGDRHFRAGNHREALRHYEAALEFPEKLSAAEFSQGDKFAQVYYAIGTAQEGLGQREAARKAFELAVRLDVQARRRRGFTPLDAAEMLYYQALSLRKLGRDAEAAELFGRLIQTGQEALRTGEAVDYFAKFGERQTAKARAAQANYSIALGYLGQAKRAEAKAELEKALAQNVNHLGAKTQLSGLGN